MPISLMRFGRLFIGWFVVCFFTVLCYGGERNDAWELLSEETFKTYLSVNPPQAAIDVGRAEKMQRLRGWSVSRNGFPADYIMQPHERGFRVGSAKELTLYALRIEPMNRDIRVEFTLASLNGKGNSSVELACQESKLGISSLRTIQTFMPPDDTPQTCSFEISAMDQYDFIRPRLVIRGDVLLHSMRVYYRTIAGLSVIEGEIVERSLLPPPKESDYPDCRYTAKIIGNTILAGERCNREIALVLEGFKDYKLLKTAELGVGDKIRCTIIPFDLLPDEYKTTQQADDLLLFDLDNYYVLTAARISKYESDTFFPSSGIVFSDGHGEYISIFDRRVNSPIQPEHLLQQKEQIAADLARLNSILDGLNERADELNRKFNSSWNAEQSRDLPGRNRVGKYVWREIDGSFWCLPQDYSLIDNPRKMGDDRLAALIALNDALSSNGCQLIVSIVPDAYAIAARVINSDFRNIPDYQTAILARQLTEANIETIYASDRIITHYNRHPWAFLFPKDIHPADLCQDILAEIAAERLQRYRFPQPLDPEKISFSQHTNASERDIYRFPDNCDIADNLPGSRYTNRQVLYDGKRLDKDPNSPILVLGNSFIQTPVTPPDSYPALLAAKLLHGVEYYRVSGAHSPMTTIVQELFTNPERLLKGKKVVILQLGVHHFLDPAQWNDLHIMDSTRRQRKD